jgi:hypothetical protein
VRTINFAFEKGGIKSGILEIINLPRGKFKNYYKPNSA